MCLFVRLLGMYVMGWLRLVGSLKLQVSFAKEPCKRAYILQKKPVILRSLPVIATSYGSMYVMCLRFDVCLYVCHAGVYAV